MRSEEGKRPRGRRIMITLALLLIVVLTVLYFTAPIIARRTVNRFLHEHLQPRSDVARVHLNLMTGAFGVENLVVQQPEGFAGAPLLHLRALNIHLPIGTVIRQDPVIVQNLHLDGLDLNLISDSNAVINVTRISPPPPEAPAPESAPLPPVWIRKLLLDNARLTLRDLALEWDLRIDDIRLEVENLHIAHGEPGEPAIIRLDLTLPEGRTPGRMRVRAKVGPVHPSRSNSLPAMQIAIGLFGFDLDLIDPFLARGARTAIGGAGLDIHGLIEIHAGDSLAEQLLSGTSEMTTDGGHTIRATVGGTVAEPEIPIVAVLATIAGNQFGRVKKLGGNIVGGGVEAGMAVTRTGGEAVKGGGRTVGKFGGGILQAAKGIATLDAESAGQGMSDATVGTFGEAVGTVSKTTSAAWSGLGDTVRTATEAVDTDRWWAEVAQREEAFEDNVATWFADTPFPPGSPEPDPEQVEQHSRPIPDLE